MRRTAYFTFKGIFRGAHSLKRSSWSLDFWVFLFWQCASHCCTVDLLACMLVCSTAGTEEYQTLVPKCSHRDAFPEEDVYYLATLLNYWSWCLLSFGRSTLNRKMLLQTDYFHRFWVNNFLLTKIFELFHSWKQVKSVTSVAVNFQRVCSHDWRNSVVKFQISNNIFLKTNFRFQIIFFSRQISDFK